MMTGWNPVVVDTTNWFNQFVSLEKKDTPVMMTRKNGCEGRKMISPIDLQTFTVD